MALVVHSGRQLFVHLLILVCHFYSCLPLARHPIKFPSSVDFIWILSLFWSTYFICLSFFFASVIGLIFIPKFSRTSVIIFFLHLNIRFRLYIHISRLYNSVFIVEVAAPYSSVTAVAVAAVVVASSSNCSSSGSGRGSSCSSGRYSYSGSGDSSGGGGGGGWWLVVGSSCCCSNSSSWRFSILNYCLFIRIKLFFSFC